MIDNSIEKIDLDSLNRFDFPKLRNYLEFSLF
jgi:hypothetical protein